MLVDTHAHLNFAAYKEDSNEVLQRCRELGMKIINVGSQFSTSERAVKLAQEHPGFLYAAVGLHPVHLFELEYDEVELPFKTRQEEFSPSAYEKLLQQKNVVAIGETGLDYFHTPKGVSIKEFKNKQKLTFIKEIQLAQKYNLPLILHCRGSREKPLDAYQDMLSVIKDCGYYKAVVHCFVADWQTAKSFLDLGLMISFTGIITFPKTKDLEEVVKKAPLDRIMAETDAPYLAPQLVRGQRNEPRFVQYVISRIAEIKGGEFDQVNDALTQNAIKFFGL